MRLSCSAVVVLALLCPAAAEGQIPAAKRPTVRKTAGETILLKSKAEVIRRIGAPDWTERVDLDRESRAWPRYVGTETVLLGWGPQTLIGASPQRHSEMMQVRLVNGAAASFLYVPRYSGSVDALLGVSEVLSWNPGPPHALSAPIEGMVGVERGAVWQFKTMTVIAQVLTVYSGPYRRDGANLGASQLDALLKAPVTRLVLQSNDFYQPRQIGPDGCAQDLPCQSEAR